LASKYWEKRDENVNELLKLVEKECESSLVSETNEVELKTFILSKSVLDEKMRYFQNSILQAICAFMNTQGGIIVVGVRDKKNKLGKLVWNGISDEEIEWVSDDEERRFGGERERTKENQLDTYQRYISREIEKLLENRTDENLSNYVIVKLGEKEKKIICVILVGPTFCDLKKLLKYSYNNESGEEVVKVFYRLGNQNRSILNEKKDFIRNLEKKMRRTCGPDNKENDLSREEIEQLVEKGAEDMKEQVKDEIQKKLDKNSVEILEKLIADGSKKIIENIKSYEDITTEEKRPRQQDKLYEKMEDFLVQFLKDFEDKQTNFAKKEKRVFEDLIKDLREQIGKSEDRSSGEHWELMKVILNGIDGVKDMLEKLDRKKEIQEKNKGRVDYWEKEIAENNKAIEQEEDERRLEKLIETDRYLRKMLIQAEKGEKEKPIIIPQSPPQPTPPEPDPPDKPVPIPPPSDRVRTSKGLSDKGGLIIVGAVLLFALAVIGMVIYNGNDTSVSIESSIVCAEGFREVNGRCEQIAQEPDPPREDPLIVCAEGFREVNGRCEQIAQEPDPPREDPLIVCAEGFREVNGRCEQIAQEPAPAAQTEITINSVTVKGNSVTVIVSITGDFDHWHIQLNSPLSLGDAGGIMVRSGLTHTFDNIVAGEHTVHVGAVDSMHYLIGEQASESFTIAELIVEPKPEPIILNEYKRIILRGQSNERGANKECNKYLQTAEAGNYEPKNPKVIYFGQMGGGGETPFCAKSIIVFDLTDVFSNLENHDIKSVVMSYTGLATDNNPNGSEESCNELFFGQKRSQRYYCSNPDEYLIDENVGLGTELKYYFSSNDKCNGSFNELFNEQETWNEIDWMYKSPDSSKSGENDISIIKDNIDREKVYLCISFTDSQNRVGDTARNRDNYQLYALDNIEIKFNFVLK
jgi:hypothetical protein